MKIIKLVSLMVVFSFIWLLAWCQNSDKVIKIGVIPVPQTEILNQITDNLAAEGYSLEIVEYNDYVTPNLDLENGKLDANYFQHKPYLDDFNEKEGTHLVAVADVNLVPLAIYLGNFLEIQTGLTIAIPDDPTNKARALLLLQSQSLLTLSSDNPTIDDIVANPYDITIKEYEASKLPSVLDSVDLAVINGNFALQAGLKDKLAVEDTDSKYANVIAVKEGNENLEKIKVLKKVLLTDEVREFINGKYDWAVVAAF